MWESNPIDDYYRMVADPDNKDEGAIEIVLGPFTGLIYKYGDFRLKKAENEDDQPTIEYQFEVINIPEEMRGVQYPDEMKESFDKLLVDILIDLVQKDSAEEVRVDYDSTNGEGDIDESFERRVFYKIDNPVPEG